MLTGRKFAAILLGQLLAIGPDLFVRAADNSSLRVCNTEDDMQVEFSECDPLGKSRNGKSNFAII